MTKTIKFKFERATKRTYRFEEIPEPGQASVVGTLYVQQHVFTGQPEKLTVTITDDGQ